jgi:membrane-bound serine protease (ClpP class)
VATLTLPSVDIKALTSHFGYEEKDVRDAKPHWLDTLAAFLRRTEVSALLVLLGIAGLILELKVPGLTVPGILSAICFLLFFWSQSQLSGQIIYLAILLFLLGVILIGIEIFILPGFGVTGVAGIILVIGGLGLATIERLPQSTEEWVDLGSKMTVFGGAMVGSIVVVMALGRFLPKLPMAERLMLIPPTEKLEESIVLPGVELAQSLLGLTGTAVSTLRPAGAARINEQFVDVVSEGDFIEPGTPIQVIEVEGTRIVVKKI